MSWIAAPGLELVVTGYKLSEPDLLAVANGLRDEPGTNFTYPARPDIEVTRASALSTAAKDATEGTRC